MCEASFLLDLLGVLSKCEQPIVEVMVYRFQALRNTIERGTVGMSGSVECLMPRNELRVLRRKSFMLVQKLRTSRYALDKE